jgi:outer membrane protein OmpA-like peptidoglycan-associated protein/tetratricopeptide (TPR) repeat protein
MLLSKKFVFFTLLLLLVTSVNAQSKRWLTFKASNKTSESKFEEGIKLYKQALAKDSTFYKANIELADTYYYLGEFDSALVYYKKAITYPKKDTNYIDLLGYANCLRILNQPEKALETFNLFEQNYTFTNKPIDQKLKVDIILNKNYCIESMKKNNTINENIFVENLGNKVNTEESEYGTVFLNDDSTLLYTARHKDYRKEYTDIDDKFYENIYFYNYKKENGGIYAESDKQSTHYAVVGVIPETDSLIVYYKNVLWFAKYNDKNLLEKQELPIELSGFSHQPSGVFTKNKKTFIFSARVNKEDNLNLYQSNLQDNGKWSNPQIISNLSSIYDDDSPYLTENDTVLYFSSKGFNSSGDYDIYKSIYQNGTWSKPLNMPYPVNSPGDDIYFEINEDNYAFLSSNRKDGFGLMDIYKVQFPPKPFVKCTTFENTDLTVDLDIFESDDSSSVPLKYEWLFDDGETFTGEKVTKTFKYPGLHHVDITIIDESSGLIEKNEVHEDLNIENVNYVGFTHPNHLFVDTLTSFDASVSYVDGNEIKNYFWKINDVLLDIDQPLLEQTFTKKDTITITLQVNVLDSNKNYKSYCYSKKLPVIGPDDLFKDTLNDLFVDSLKYSNFYPDDSTNYIIGNGNIIDTLIIKPIYFGFDKANLDRQDKKQLDSLLLFLKQYPNVKVIVAGHTDAMGSSDYNIRLSKKRIKSTIAYLKENGLSSDRIYKTIGYGETKPIQPNTLPDGRDNPKGRKLNRRVEFIIFTNNG